MHRAKPRSRSPAILRALLAACCWLIACAETGPYIWVDKYKPPNPGEQSTEYVLVPGDVIQVRVFNQEAMSAPKVRVRADGKVSLAFLNDVQAEGHTPAQFAKKLETLWREFVHQPVVTVTLEEMHPTQVSVVGEVAKPGVYPIEPGQGVLRALAAAGGLTQFAHQDRIYVLRQASAQRIRFRMEDLALPGTPAAKFSLLANDAIIVE